MRYLAKPDFQNMTTGNGFQLIGAYQQEGLYYQYPLNVVRIKDNPALDFSLEVIRSEDTQNAIYGKLKFTTEFEYSEQMKIDEFKSEQEDVSILSLPFSPFRLGFYAPENFESKLSSKTHTSSWHTTQNAHFLIVLDAQSSLLIEKTIRDGVIGFQARLDACVEGVSPRLNTIVQFDPKQLFDALQDQVPGDLGIYDYYSLQNALSQSLDSLPFEFTEAIDGLDKRQLGEAILDRLFNQLGALQYGSARSNRSVVYLDIPKDKGRLIFDLSEIELSKRPLTFQLDPFAAAQELAKTDPDQVLFRHDSPVMPGGKKSIDIIAVLPPGLSRINSIMQIKVPVGSIYPVPQEETIELNSDVGFTSVTFYPNNVEGPLSYTYQVRVQYPTSAGFQVLDGTEMQSVEEVLTIDRNRLPCTFFTISADTQLTAIAKLKGVIHMGNLEQSFELSQAEPNFSYPVLSDDSYATITAVSLAGNKEVILPARIVESTEISQLNFSQFGPQKALIQTVFPEDLDFQEVEFQPEGKTDTSKYTFSRLQTKYKYKWNSNTIFEDRFRYKITGGEWSDYVQGDQVIKLNKVENAE